MRIGRYSRPHQPGTVTCINGDAVRALCSMEQKVDRIVFGGLFDYLNARAIRLLLKISFERLLKKGGRIVFTNLSTHSTFDMWLEFLASWQMTYRTKNKIVDLVNLAEIPPELLTIKFDSTGLSLLWEIEGQARTHPLPPHICVPPALWGGGARSGKRRDVGLMYRCANAFVADARSCIGKAGAFNIVQHDADQVASAFFQDGVCENEEK